MRVAEPIAISATSARRTGLASEPSPGARARSRGRRRPGQRHARGAGSAPDPAGSAAPGRGAGGARQRLLHVLQREAAGREAHRIHLHLEHPLLSAPGVHLHHAADAAQQRGHLELRDLQQLRGTAAWRVEREVEDLAQTAGDRSELGRRDAGRKGQALSRSWTICRARYTSRPSWNTAVTDEMP